MVTVGHGGEMPQKYHTPWWPWHFLRHTMEADIPESLTRSWRVKVVRFSVVKFSCRFWGDTTLMATRNPKGQPPFGCIPKPCKSWELRPTFPSTGERRIHRIGWIAPWWRHQASTSYWFYDFLFGWCLLKWWHLEVFFFLEKQGLHRNIHASWDGSL